jgi:hypothetical protein
VRPGEAGVGIIRGFTTERVEVRVLWSVWNIGTLSMSGYMVRGVI